MEKFRDICGVRHCILIIYLHLVFVTKYRRGVFTNGILDDLKPIFASMCAEFEAEPFEADGEDDHVHLLNVRALYPRPEGRVFTARCINSPMCLWTAPTKEEDVTP